jgi:hypothetical protein
MAMMQLVGRKKNGVTTECSPVNGRCGLRRMAQRHLEFGTAWGSGLTYPSVRDREGLTEEIADWKGGRRTKVAVDAEFRDDDRVCYNCFYLFYAFLLSLLSESTVGSFADQPSALLPINRRRRTPARRS